MLLGALLLLVCVQSSSTSRHLPLPRPYNVLILSPTGSRSHQGLLMPIAVALADRGHQVSVIALAACSSQINKVKIWGKDFRLTEVRKLNSTFFFNPNKINIENRHIVINNISFMITNLWSIFQNNKGLLTGFLHYIGRFSLFDRIDCRWCLNLWLANVRILGTENS